MPLAKRRSAALLVVALSTLGCGGGDASTTAPPSFASPPGPIDLKVMTYNVMCSFCDAGYDPWNARVPYMADVVERHQPDLVGFQEFTTGDEVRQLAALVPGYDAVFLTDPNAPLFKEYGDATLWVRSSKFEILERGFYFLSKDPDVNWSSGWAGGQFWRLVAWAHLRQRSDGRELYFATTHFDNNSPNQEMSAPLLLERTKPWAERMPTIVVGDFNSRPDSKAYEILTHGAEPGGFALQNAFDVAPTVTQVHNQPSTPAYDRDDRIDHIFVAGPSAWSCSSWTVDQTVYGASAKYPSDHFPVVATLRFEL